MQVQVIFAKAVDIYLVELMQILYDKEYFGFEASAVEYVSELVDDIVTSLPNKIRKEAPEYFDRYGEGLYYSVFKRNRNTQWYVFFNYEDDVFLIRYIGNNHINSQHL